jgi:hypothetical protein
VFPWEDECRKDFAEERAVARKRGIELKELLGPDPTEFGDLRLVGAKLLGLGVDDPPVEDEVAVIRRAFPRLRDRRYVDA